MASNCYRGLKVNTLIRRNLPIGTQTFAKIRESDYYSGSSTVLVELGETDKHPLLKVGEIAKTVTHTFQCFDRIVNAIDDARRESMREIV